MPHSAIFQPHDGNLQIIESRPENPETDIVSNDLGKLSTMTRNQPSDWPWRPDL